MKPVVNISIQFGTLYYKFEIVVTEGSDEFWEELTANGKSGCDEVKAQIEEALVEQYIDITIELVEYKNDSR